MSMRMAWLAGLLAVGTALGRGAGWGYDPAGWSATCGGEALADTATRCLSAAFDGDRRTGWSTGRPLRAGDWYALDLGRAVTVGRVQLDPGAARREYPRGVRLEVSVDGSRWAEVADAAQLLGDDGSLRLTFTPRPARRLRLTNLGTAPDLPWSIAEVYVWP